MPLPEVEERVRAAGNVVLFLDYDGTLTPLVADPVGERLGERPRQTLAGLSRRADTIVAVVSGRGLDHLRSRVALPDVIYAGNHGLEIEGRGLHFIEPTAAAARERLRTVTDHLEDELKSVPGAFIEHKILGTSVHYRNVAAPDMKRAEKLVRDVVAAAGGVFRLKFGKMLWEILPNTDWNKGAATRWILEQVGGEDTLSIYFGDDITDEDAFRALPEGLTFKVGCEGATDAKYRVGSPAAVEEFLEWLASR